MLTGWLFGVSTQHRRPMFSRTASTVRLYLYHNRYVLSFLSFGSGSGRGQMPKTGGAAAPIKTLDGGQLP